MNNFIQYLKETKKELKEVVFPTSSQTVTYTLIVIVISIVVAITLGSADLALSRVLKGVVSIQSPSSVGSQLQATSTPATSATTTR